MKKIFAKINRYWRGVELSRDSGATTSGLSQRVRALNSAAAWLEQDEEKRRAEERKTWAELGVVRDDKRRTTRHCLTESRDVCCGTCAISTVASSRTKRKCRNVC
ncbi:uncharacterized protein [Venturia canescens]|uniref:uncharacterized protein n=1 Tax=Venturia canescens TaxID=32260 RepID=UPI001C9C6B46|nr:uncharacterized protein LOC122415254 [Venturia canescens]